MPDDVDSPDHEGSDAEDAAAEAELQAWREQFEVPTVRFRGWLGELEDEVVGRQVAALLVTPSSLGGAYTLLSEGRTATVHPAGTAYAELRVVAHLPVAIWTLHRLSASMSPYQLGSRLRDLSGMIDRVAPVIAASRGPENGGHHHSPEVVLEACSAFLHDPGVVEDRGAVMALIDVVREPTERVMVAAARLQVRNTMSFLSTLETDLGAEWLTMVAIVGTNPTQTGDSPHVVMLRRAMGAEAEAAGRLFVAPGAHAEELLRHRLGTMLTNRDLATDWYGDARGLEEDHLTQPVIAALDSLDSLG